MIIDFWRIKSEGKGVRGKQAQGCVGSMVGCVMRNGRAALSATSYNSLDTTVHDLRITPLGYASRLAVCLILPRK